MGDFSKTVTYVKSDDQAPFPTCPECDSQIETERETQRSEVTRGLETDVL